MATVEITPEALAAMISAAVAKAVAEAKADRKDDARARYTVDGRSEKSIQNEIKAVKAFTKAGFKNVIPNQTIKTANRWIAEGRMPKKGEHALKIAGLGYRLFHIDQTEVVSPETKEKLVAQQQAVIRKFNEQRAAAKNDNTVTAA